VIAFLDSSAAIYYFEGDATAQKAVRDVLLNLKNQYPACELAVSRLGVMECRVKPLRDNAHTLLAVYEAFFMQARIVELTAAVVDMATTLRASYGLKTPDALQAASALSLGEDVVFVTADLGFARLNGLRALKVQYIT
jgi:predicted nucleic acid-binding protein